jgi:hypothetical protein
LEPEAIERFFERFDILITEVLKGVEGIDRDRAIKYFNQIGYKEEEVPESALSGFNEVKYIPKKKVSNNKLENLIYSSNRDIFLKEVANTLFLTEWYERFGLDLQQTMDMSYDEYNTMKEYLQYITEIIEQKKKELIAEEEAKQKKEGAQQHVRVPSAKTIKKQRWGNQ